MTEQFRGRGEFAPLLVYGSDVPFGVALLSRLASDAPALGGVTGQRPDGLTIVEVSRRMVSATAHLLVDESAGRDQQARAEIIQRARRDCADEPDLPDGGNYDAADLHDLDQWSNIAFAGLGEDGRIRIACKLA